MVERTGGGIELLVVAGRDSSGGAGIDADRETIARCGARAALVESARTHQDAAGLRALEPVDPARWLALAEAALERRPRALKFGLLPGPAHAAAAARLIAAARALLGPELSAVVDPVLGPTRGGRFVAPEELDAWLAALAPAGAVWTPNVPELAELTGASPEELARELEAREAAARALLARGARAVVAKGGHGREQPLVDLLVEPGRAAVRLARPRSPGPGIRGSGCRHATALALGLAAGLEPAAAAARAGERVAALVARASGRG